MVFGFVTVKVYKNKDKNEEAEIIINEKSMNAVNSKRCAFIIENKGNFPVIDDILIKTTTKLDN